MLVLINPPADVKDQVLVNTDLIVRIHPVCGRKSTADPDKTMWVLAVDMADGMSNSVGFDKEENARAVEAAIMKYMGPVVVPEMKT